MWLSVGFGKQATPTIEEALHWELSPSPLAVERCTGIAQLIGRIHEHWGMSSVLVLSLKGDRVTKAEQEVVISKCADETEWCVYCTDPSALPYYLGLSVKVGGRVVEHQGGTKIFLPQDSVLLQVKRKLHLSPERRAQLAERMKVLQATEAA